METLILFVIVYFTGYIFGWLGHAKSLLKRLTTNPDEMINILNQLKKVPESVDSEDTISVTVREIELEKINDHFYLYAKDNGQFLSQGANLDEALERVKKRFPGQAFQGLISSKEAKQMGLSN